MICKFPSFLYPLLLPLYHILSPRNHSLYVICENNPFHFFMICMGAYSRTLACIHIQTTSFFLTLPIFHRIFKVNSVFVCYCLRCNWDSREWNFCCLVMIFTCHILCHYDLSGKTYNNRTIIAGISYALCRIYSLAYLHMQNLLSENCCLFRQNAKKSRVLLVRTP